MAGERWVRDRSWNMAGKVLLFGVGKFSVPATVLPCLIFGFVWQGFWYLGVLITIFHLIRMKWGLKPNDYIRFIRNQVNLGVLSGHPRWKKRSWIDRHSYVLAFLFLPLVPSTSEANFRLIMPEQKSYTATPTVFNADRQGAVPVIARGVIQAGFGIDTPLKQVMELLKPDTFQVRFRDMELEFMEVSWRSTDKDIIEIMHDLSERYGVMFRYSNRSGLIYVEWNYEGCQSGKDSANVYQIIC